MAWLDRPVHGILVSDEQTTNPHNTSVHFIYMAPYVKAQGRIMFAIKTHLNIGTHQGKEDRWGQEV